MQALIRRLRQELGLRIAARSERRRVRLDNIQEVSSGLAAYAAQLAARRSAVVDLKNSRNTLHALGQLRAPWAQDAAVQALYARAGTFDRHTRRACFVALGAAGKGARAGLEIAGICELMGQRINPHAFGKYVAILEQSMMRVTEASEAMTLLRLRNAW